MREQEIRKQFERLYEHARRCCGDTNLISVVKEAVLLATNPGEKGAEALQLDCYDAGYFGDGGGGNVSWWHNYLRQELERAHQFYQEQVDGIRIPTALPARQDVGESAPSDLRELAQRVLDTGDLLDATALIESALAAERTRWIEKFAMLAADECDGAQIQSPKERKWNARITEVGNAIRKLAGVDESWWDKREKRCIETALRMALEWAEFRDVARGQHTVAASPPTVESVLAELERTRGAK